MPRVLPKTSLNPGSITTEEILDGTIDSIDIKNGSVTADKIKSGAVVGRSKQVIYYQSPAGCSVFDEDAYECIIENRRAYPKNAGEDSVLECGLNLPIGATLDEIIFYGELGNDASQVRCQIKRVYNYGAALPSLDTLHNDLKTGTTGVFTSTWNDGYTLAGDDCLTILVLMNGDTAGANAMWYGCKVTYTF